MDAIKSNREIKDLIAIKRKIKEILKNKIYYKNFSNLLLDKISEIDNIKSSINVEVLLVCLLF